MRLSCPDCHNVIMVDDAKVPSGVFRTPCPKCGKIVTAQKEAARPAAHPSSPHAPAASGDASPQSGDEVPLAVQAYVKREVAAARQEILGAILTLIGHDIPLAERGERVDPESDQYATKRALVCEDDQTYLDAISSVVGRLGYSVDIARSTAEAIQKVSSETYHLITVDHALPDDPEGGSKIIGKINGQKPAQRRQTLVVLISANVRSADANAAFLHGANVTLNKGELRSLEPLIREGLQHFKQVYALFDRVMAEKEERG